MFINQIGQISMALNGHIKYMNVRIAGRVPCVSYVQTQKKVAIVSYIIIKSGKNKNQI